ncbi:MAG: polysaccharide biosynthesis/export family protein [Pseudomonadota bacterium]
MSTVQRSDRLEGQMQAKLGLLLAAAFGLSACGVVYTAPDVSESTNYGGGTDYDVTVVSLSPETVVAANLVDYVPPRLPLAFQPDAAARLASRAPAAPQLPPLPAPSVPRAVRPNLIPDRFPPLLRPEPYRIGVSDVLLLSVTSAAATVDALPGLLNAQQKRNGYVVQDDGAIAVPDAGRIRVSGQTLSEAEAAIFDALVAAGIDPTFSLEIAEFNSQRVSVGGEVRGPTLVPITLKPVFLHEAVELAGGVDVPDRSVAKVQLTRGGQTYQIGLVRFFEDPAARRVVLRDGDAVFVGSEFREDAAQLRFQQELALRQQTIAGTDYAFRREELLARREQTARQALADQRAQFRDRLELGAVARDHVYLTGEVLEARRVPLPFETRASLADMLFDGTEMRIANSDYSSIYVLRPASDPALNGRLTAYRLDAENAANLALAAQLEMRPNDVVFVAEQPITSWNRALSQALPNLFITAASVAANN